MRLKAEEEIIELRRENTLKLERVKIKVKRMYENAVDRIKEQHRLTETSDDVWMAMKTALAETREEGHKDVHTLRKVGEKILRLSDQRRLKGKRSVSLLASLKWYDISADGMVVRDDGNGILMEQPGPVNLITVCGKLRTGKSYLMNAIADSQVFGVSSRAGIFTHGVLISSKLAAPKQFGIADTDAPMIGFVDMEGQAEKGIEYDTMLATPALLLSKIVLLNVIAPNGPSRQEILETLKVMMDAAKKATPPTEGSDDMLNIHEHMSTEIFGCLHVILRDCANSEAECHSLIFEDEPTEGLGQLEGKAARERNLVRAEVRVAFAEPPRTWCLPRLILADKAAPPENYRENPDEYVNKIDEMRGSIGSQLATPVLLDGSVLTGERIAHLIPPLTEALSSGEGISPPSLVEAACDAQAEPLIREALTKFEEEERRASEELLKKIDKGVIPLQLEAAQLDRQYKFAARSDAAYTGCLEQMREKRLLERSITKAKDTFDTRIGQITEELEGKFKDAIKLAKAQKAFESAQLKINQLQTQLEAQMKQVAPLRSEVHKLSTVKAELQNTQSLASKRETELLEERDKVKHLQQELVGLRAANDDGLSRLDSISEEDEMVMSRVMSNVISRFE